MLKVRNGSKAEVVPALGLAAYPSCEPTPSAPKASPNVTHLFIGAGLN